MERKRLDEATEVIEGVDRKLELRTKQFALLMSTIQNLKATLDEDVQMEEEEEEEQLQRQQAEVDEDEDMEDASRHTRTSTPSRSDGTAAEDGTSTIGSRFRGQRLTLEIVVERRRRPCAQPLASFAVTSRWRRSRFQGRVIEIRARLRLYSPLLLSERAVLLVQRVCEQQAEERPHSSASLQMSSYSTRSSVSPLQHHRQQSSGKLKQVQDHCRFKATTFEDPSRCGRARRTCRRQCRAAWRSLRGRSRSRS